tara:strand:- start:228 stop:1034 length:807 start_codon:yes stop_codon:yes gene_type:complete
MANIESKITAIKNEKNIELANKIESKKINNEYKIELNERDHIKKKCCSRDYEIKDWKMIYKIVEALPDLDNLDRNLLLIRFKRISNYINNEFKLVSNFYNVSKLFAITAGILNPALLSINNDKGNSNYNFIYWSVWSIQLSVSIITSFTSFYKWDKKYFLYNAYKSKINQEIWFYLELTGRYSVKNEKNKREKQLGKVTHKTKLRLFLGRIEHLFQKLREATLDIEATDDDSKNDNDNIHIDDGITDKEILESFEDDKKLNDTQTSIV